MRFGRAKAARKTLQYFARTVGLKPPYHVLLDGSFIVSMFQSKLPIRDRMYSILQLSSSGGGMHFYILASLLKELRALVSKLANQKHEKAAFFQQALEWATNECTVIEKENDDESSTLAETTATPTTELFYQHIASADHPYVVATQDEGLLDKLRKLGTVPIIRLANSSVVLLENPSKASQSQTSRDETAKWKDALSSKEKVLVKLVKTQQTKKPPTASLPPPPQENRRKSKAKGANPLSCKKKRSTEDTQPKNKRRRTKSTSSPKNS
jgi:rRNA-processing protein FCF1